MSRKRILPQNLLFLMVLVLALFCGEVRGAEKARIEGAFVVNSQTDLLLYFTVVDALSPEMKKGILNGIPVTFAFFVELHEHRGGKSPVQVASRNFRHTIHFQTLKELFDLELTEHGKESVSFDQFDLATRALADVHDLPLVSLALLKPGVRYTVKIKARLAKQDLPEKFKNVMTFIKIWDFETEWRELSFAMAPAKPADEEGSNPSSNSLHE